MLSAGAAIADGAAFPATAGGGATGGAGVGAGAGANMAPTALLLLALLVAPARPVLRALWSPSGQAAINGTMVWRLMG